jgi:subtilisin family serine protease
VVGGFPPNIWITWSGTSFAAPKVAGVAALIKSARPALNAVQVEAVLIGAVDVLSGLSGKVASGGRLNAGSAVAGPQPGDPSDEQFFYRASDGLFLYYDVSSIGALKSLLRSGKYSPGWSSIMAIDLDGDGKDEQFFYRASDGLFLYYDVSSSGALTSLLRSGKYSPGWSSIMAIDLDG